MKQLCLAALLSLALAAPAEAARPTYSFLEASYLHSEVDANPDVPGDTSSEARGQRINFNLSLSRWAYFTSEFDRLDTKGAEEISTAVSAGFGAHTLKSNFQLFSIGSYERRDLNRPGIPDVKDEGYGVQVGFRLPVYMLELQGDYKYLDFGELANGERDDDQRYRALLQARLTDTTALTASYEKFDQSEVEQWTAGLRFYFLTRHDVRRVKRSAPAAASVQ